MGLYIPTSGDPRQRLVDRPVTKGQLYNLTSNEKLTFQFNPEVFEWEQASHWAEAWRRNHGTRPKRQFIGTADIEFDLRLLYVADPDAPDFTLELNDQPGEFGNSAFVRIREGLDRWQKARPTTGLPDPLLVIFGDDIAFEAQIASINFKIVEFFRDLTAREALIDMEFFGWPANQRSILS